MDNTEFEQVLALYEYSFPPELIANAPANPRESQYLFKFRVIHRKIVLFFVFLCERLLATHLEGATRSDKLLDTHLEGATRSDKKWLCCLK